MYQAVNVVIVIFLLTFEYRRRNSTESLILPIYFLHFKYFKCLGFFLHFMCISYFKWKECIYYISCLLLIIPSTNHHETFNNQQDISKASMMHHLLLHWYQMFFSISQWKPNHHQLFVCGEIQIIIIFFLKILWVFLRIVPSFWSFVLTVHGYLQKNKKIFTNRFVSNPCSNSTDNNLIIHLKSTWT